MSFALFTFQRAGFNNQFGSHFTNDFELWFTSLAKKLHPSGDVQAIRLTQGDGKLDVAVLSEQLVYQCYAPSDFKPKVAAEKITTNFWGCHQHLEGRLRKWIFVHNHPTGELDKDCYKALNDLVAECEDRGLEIEILAWGIEQLWSALQTGISHSELRDLFGSPDPVNIDYACIEELLHHLERASYPEDAAEVPQPALDKLEFNKLGPAYQMAIREGRNALRVVEGYLSSRASSDPEFGEELAQRFRDRYRHWKDRGTFSANDIYEKLRLDAGWKASPDVQRELATRAILAYFFDSCDIFENPPIKP